jgi:hypothetical protein
LLELRSLIVRHHPLQSASKSKRESKREERGGRNEEREIDGATGGDGKPGRHGDGGNLYLHVEPSGARRWVFRFVIAGKATEAGLGSADVVSLAEARERAALHPWRRARRNSGARDRGRRL